MPGMQRSEQLTGLRPLGLSGVACFYASESPGASLCMPSARLRSAGCCGMRTRGIALRAACCGRFCSREDSLACPVLLHVGFAVSARCPLWRMPDSVRGVRRGAWFCFAPVPFAPSSPYRRFRAEMAVAAPWPLCRPLLAAPRRLLASVLLTRWPQPWMPFAPAPSHLGYAGRRLAKFVFAVVAK